MPVLDDVKEAVDIIKKVGNPDAIIPRQRQSHPIRKTRIKNLCQKLPSISGEGSKKR
uniref:Uncharacterized protein n=1 Tax=Kuenenia stuttgartiensis TaxID=174633 RepID=Q1PVY1_KUEST|nr:unknown protein [Candidatus Kuenenia stuttgartiensis]